MGRSGEPQEGCTKRQRGKWLDLLTGATALLLTLGLTGLFLHAGGGFTLDPAVIDAAAKRYGEEARRRLLAWEELANSDDGASDHEKLDKVNRFFNRLEFVSDQLHWGERDYWATPVEFLASDGGDCEDFAVAKYFTLRLLGVADEKMSLTYVKAWKINQAHMVLTYYEQADGIPLVLDNLVGTIEPADKRPDLLPVYSFNGSGLWLARERGKGNHIGGSGRLKLWNDLLTRLPASLRTALPEGGGER